jgi:hypothetical protein
MKTTTLFGLIAAASLALSGGASAAGYQVKGKVTKVGKSTFTVENGKQKWEVARDANTKVKGELKPGAEVTVNYMLHATSVDAKASAGTNAAKAQKKEEPQAAAAKKAMKTSAPPRSAAEPDAQKKEAPQTTPSPAGN